MALNTIFRKWNISSSMSDIRWNTSNDICSDHPLSEEKAIESVKYNPSIICLCNLNNDSICHITRLKAYGLNIVGRIPEELKDLTYLEYLQIGDNYLTGPLPAFIGNFSKMQYLSIGRNSLSGNVPKELGNLQKLISLGIDFNNFSGPLPPELGNLTNLEQMYLDSMGVSGGIPETFVKLQKLKIMMAADNNFGGNVPVFFGEMPNLEILRFHGNNFQGPIPSSFATLTKLTELRLGDLSNGSSSLLFIENMTSLTTLILRNSKISDFIPSDFGKYTNMEHLDLSFNNLTGRLPPTLFNLPNLEHLYLGNNSISGDLPVEKSGQLLNIDLSYNDLSGSLPSWVKEEDLQLNLVANNFDESNSDFPWGLRCLQKDVPCFRDSPVYYSFAINCGGNDFIEPAGTNFEADNQDLSTASYYVKDTRRWAVSSVGRFLEAPNPNYTELSLSNISKTSYPKLFQTVRLSPSSLRYYGLALENGNYTVTLQFAELAFPDNHTYLSLGNRVFDIYIQGKLMAKDFNIRKEAGGRSFTAIYQNYTAIVTKNFLEIHLFWAGKGTMAIVPTRGYYGPSISAISVTPNFKPTVSNHLPHSSKKTGALVAGITVGVVAALFILLIIGTFMWRQKERRVLEDEAEELRGLAIVPHTFSFIELKAATNGFSPSNKLGEGGFGAVFKGKLADGRIVAVKQLYIASIEGKRQFVTEVATISAVQHRNLVKLYGCCYEGDNRLLVYEFVENNSLDHALFGKSGLLLDWPARFEICLGIARGLSYLHEEARIRIVHRDVKASNILLDAHLNPKISDFGLAKLYDDRMTHVSTRVAGTVGYLAPEYAMRGHLTEKADIFGFGVVVLEILCGRPNTGTSLDGEKMYLLEWAWQLHENNCDLDMLDPTLRLFSKEEANRMIKVAFLCTQANFLLRPPMSRVVAMLVGDMEISDVTSKPPYLTDWKYDDWGSRLLAASTAEDFTISNLTSMTHSILPSKSLLESVEGR